jgi:c-di-GMP-binding flagellar brake protein YcgR
MEDRRKAVMHWPRMGERVLIEVVPPGEAYTGEVRDVGNDHTLIVSIPQFDPDVLVGDPAVRLTFVRKDGLYETSGAVQVVEPGEADDTANLVVRLADEAARTQRRDFIRRDASLNAELEWNGSRARCVTKEVSGGGVSVIFPEPPPVSEGMEFTLTLNLPDGREAIRTRCRTKYVREILRGSRWLAGSQFVDIGEDDRQRIVRFVFRLELAQKRAR